MFVHQISPYVFKISDSLAIQWYGLSFFLSFICSFLLLHWMLSRQKNQFPKANVGQFLIFSMISTLFFSRLGYCLFYSPDLFLKFQSEAPFWAPFAVNEGGLSFFGGLIGLIVCSTIYAVHFKISRLYLYDLVALCIPVSLFWNRLASFMTGEMIGKISPPQFPLSVKFPQEILYWPHRSPEKIQDIAKLIDPSHFTSEQNITAASSDMTEIHLQSLYHLLDKIRSGNWELLNQLTPYLSERYPTQIFSALLEGFLLFFILFVAWYRPRKSGVISSLFLILFSAFYFSLEFFRELDLSDELLLGQLTMGQILSMFTFFIGLLSLFIWGRRETLPIPGWGRAQSVKLHRR